MVRKGDIVHDEEKKAVVMKTQSATNKQVLSWLFQLKE
jgi:hypothetical protein